MKYLVLALGVLAAAGAARADSGFRCESGRLVSIGDHMLEVQKKCGDPDFTSQRVDKRKVRHKVKRWTGEFVEEVVEEEVVEVVLDEWTYDLGPKRFMRTVVFENTRVVTVATQNKPPR